MKAPPSAKAIKHRCQTAKNARGNWTTSYRDVFTYCMPDRYKFDQEISGAMKDRTYTSVPIEVTQEFAGSMMQNLTPSDLPWISLDVRGGAGLSELEPEEREVITEAEKRLRDSIEESNFATQAHGFYMDLAAGTACMRVERAATYGERLRFTTVPLTDLYLEVGALGEPRTVFWERSMSLGQAEKTYGYDALREHFEKTTTPQDKAQTRMKQIRLIESCIEMRPAPGEEAFSHRYYCSVVDPAHEKLLEGRGEDVSPYVVARWATVASELYGRGPAWVALPDMKVLNKLVELIIRRVDQSVNPILMVQNNGILNPDQLKLEPGMLVPVNATNAQQGPPIAALEMKSDFQAALIDQERLERSIKKIMLVEDFTPLEGGTKSREEVLIRNQEFQRRLGAVYPRMLREWITPLVYRIMFVLDSAGEFADLPMNVADLVYKPGKAIGERQAVTAATERYVGLMAGIMQVPAVAATLQVDKLPMFIADHVGMPTWMVKSAEEVQETAQQIGAMGEQALQSGAGANPSGPYPPPSTP